MSDVTACIYMYTYLETLGASLSEEATLVLDIPSVLNRLMF